MRRVRVSLDVFWIAHNCLRGRDRVSFGVQKGHGGCVVEGVKVEHFVARIRPRMTVEVSVPKTSAGRPVRRQGVAKIQRVFHARVRPRFGVEVREIRDRRGSSVE